MDQRSLDSREEFCAGTMDLSLCCPPYLLSHGRLCRSARKANLQRHLPYPSRCDRREDCRVVRKCFILPVQIGMQWKSMRTYGDSPDMFKKWLGVHVSDHSILWCDEPWTPSRGRPDLWERSFFFEIYASHSISASGYLPLMPFLHDRISHASKGNTRRLFNFLISAISTTPFHQLKHHDSIC